MFKIKIFNSNKEIKPAKKKGTGRAFYAVSLILVLILLASSSRTVAEYPWNGNPLTWLKAREIYEQGKYSRSRYMLVDAGNKLKRAIKLYPNDWRFHAELALNLQYEKKFPEAVIESKKALELHPKDPDLAMQLAYNSYLNNDITESTKAVEEAIKLSPTTAAPVVLKALILQSQNQAEKAKTVYESTHQMHKDSPLYWYLCGEYYANLQDAQATEANFRQASLTDQTNAEYWETLGTVLLKKGDYDNGIVCLRRATTLNPRDLVYLNNLASIYTSTGNISSAAECYYKATSLDPRNPGSWFRFGLTLFYNKQYLEAEHPLWKGLQLNPSSDDRLWGFYFETLEKQNKYKFAAKQLNDYLKRPGKQSTAKNLTYLAHLQLKAYQYKQAEETLSRVEKNTNTADEKTKIQELKQELAQAEKENPNPSPEDAEQESNSAAENTAPEIPAIGNLPLRLNLGSSKSSPSATPVKESSSSAKASATPANESSSSAKESSQ